jgi:DNA-binding PadR family transcriptional regulator
MKTIGCTRIGYVQDAMLRYLSGHGCWHVGCDWPRSMTDSRVTRVLDSLVRRGFVIKTGGGGRLTAYHLTEAGADLVLADRISVWKRNLADRAISAYGYKQMEQHWVEQLNGHLLHAAQRATEASL